MTFISILIGKRGETIDNTVILTNVFKLDEFYYFEKTGIKELCLFIARTSFSRANKGTITNVQHKGYYFTVLTNNEGLSICAVLNNNEYPIRVLHRILKNTLEKYINEHGDKWKIINNDLLLPMQNLSEKLNDFADPVKVDKIYKINNDLDSTKEIIHKTIDKVLERGEKIDVLVQRSKDLSKSSKQFYKTAIKMNRCCTIL
jgi:synaptobrevin homolog YKT6